MAINNTWLGSLLNDGTPTLSISIAGSDSTRQYDAIVDTGFNGFLSIPQAEADGLGIIQRMTERVFFADNSSHIRWTSVTTVMVGNEHREGIVYLEPASEEVLIGVEFFRKFERMFLYFPSEKFVSCTAKSEAHELLDHFQN